MRFESTCSGASKKHHRQGGLPCWLNLLDFGLGGFLTKILKSTCRPTVARANALIMSHFYLQPNRGGFQVDSPVKKPRASEMARCAPPYTYWAREEPWEGGGGPSCRSRRSKKFVRTHCEPENTLKQKESNKSSKRQLEPNRCCRFPWSSRKRQNQGGNNSIIGEIIENSVL